MRAILVSHRWLGVIVGAIMTLWCLSGFVMMYSDYPRLTPQEQVRGLAPLRLPDTRVWGRVPLAAEAELSSLRVEMMAGRPVLRIARADRPLLPRISARTQASPDNLDLVSGRVLAPVSAAQALRIGADFGRHLGVAGAPVAVVPTAIDQWNVQTYRRHKPMHRIDYPGGETAYVAASGEVVQQTTRGERILGWLGAVPHWLYPTLIRQDGALWAQVVIWTSVAGCFLTATGLWIGVARLRRGRDGKLGSPFRGLWWWHHMAGLFFGVLTLTWVASGLFTMNPWGFLDSDAGPAARERLAGPPVRWEVAAAALAALPPLPAGTVRLEAIPLKGSLFLRTIAGDGTQMRFDASGRRAPLERVDLTQALAGSAPLASLELLREEDTYYYSHRDPVSLPVWRAILDDPQKTRLYLDPHSGQLLRTTDATGRASRWLRNGLHSLDLPVLRTRPLRDLVVVPLLLLVTAVCFTGTWMGFKKIQRDLRRAFNRRRWHAAKPRRPYGAASEPHL